MSEKREECPCEDSRSVVWGDVMPVTHPGERCDIQTPASYTATVEGVEGVGATVDEAVAHLIAQLNDQLVNHHGNAKRVG